MFNDETLRHRLIEETTIRLFIPVGVIKPEPDHTLKEKEVGLFFCMENDPSKILFGAFNFEKRKIFKDRSMADGIFVVFKRVITEKKELPDVFDQSKYYLFNGRPAIHRSLSSFDLLNFTPLIALRSNTRIPTPILLFLNNALSPETYQP